MYEIPISLQRSKIIHGYIAILEHINSNQEEMYFSGFLEEKLKYLIFQFLQRKILIFAQQNRK